MDMLKFGKHLKTGVEKMLFNAKWLLIPFYFGLIIALGVYLFWFVLDIGHLLGHIFTLTKEEGMVVILELVDIVMIGNLIKMIITGSYTSFITKDHAETAEKSSSGLLKVKMSTSLIGVSSIHLLQSFIDAEKTTWDDLTKQMWIHGMFLLGALVLMIIEYIHVKCEVLEHGIEHEHGNAPAKTEVINEHKTH
jgi:uncharacterized protein (TIGR00645 family)